MATEIIDMIFAADFSPLAEILTMKSPSRYWPGVYVLYVGSGLVYVGKAHNIVNRLRQHYRKINRATHIGVEEVSFKIMPCGFDLMDGIEARLIYLERPEWNTTGFGNNPMGSGRIGQKTCAWNIRYGL